VARTARGDNIDMRVIQPCKTCKDESEQQSDKDKEAKGMGNFVVNMAIVLARSSNLVAVHWAHIL